MHDNDIIIIPISLGMVNTFLIKGIRSILVDTGIPGSEKKILEKLSLHGVKPTDISLILLTHCHSDHFGSAAALKEITGARVAIHQSEAEALRQGMNVDIVPTGGFGRFFKLLMSGTTQFPPVEPDILIEQELSLDEFGGEGKVISTPGHTSGSMSVMLTNKEK